MESDADSELIGILKNLNLRVDVKSKGWEYVLGLTATEEGLNHLILSGKYIPFILSYIQQDKVEKELLSHAYKCLINISNQEKGATLLVENKKDLPEYLLQKICNEDEKFTQPMCYILSNLSSHSELNKLITDVLVSSEDLLQKLMKKYCSNKAEVRSQCDFLTLVFANISRLTPGRRLFLKDSNFMTSIFTFTNSKEPEVRRLGVALILRNCCFEIDEHEKLLKDLSILPVLLLPLMDSMEFDEDEMEKLPIECQCLEDTKERDKNPSVRKILVQALIALCYSEKGWDFIIAHGAYYVLRELHKWETCEQVKDTVENFVNYTLIEEYSRPKELECVGEDSQLIQQLEADIIRDLPDYVV